MDCTRKNISNTSKCQLQTPLGKNNPAVILPGEQPSFDLGISPQKKDLLIPISSKLPKAKKGEFLELIGQEKLEPTPDHFFTGNSFPGINPQVALYLKIPL